MVDKAQINFSLLFCGLDGTGKTFLARMISGETNKWEILPTAGFQVHYVKGDQQFLIYDVSGNGRHRENWRIFYEVVDGICFFIDIQDEERIEYVKRAIREMMSDEQVQKKKIPIQFFINKTDLENDKMDVKELLEKLEIKRYERTSVNKVAYKEISGKKYEDKEIQECIDWIRDNRPKKNK